MGKYKAGLQKDVEEIFEGVKVSKGGNIRRLFGSGMPNHIGYVHTKPPSLTKQIPLIRQTQPSSRALPKAAVPKRSKKNPIIRLLRRIFRRRRTKKRRESISRHLIH